MVRWLTHRWPIRVRDDRGVAVTLVPPPTYRRGEVSSAMRPKYLGTHAGRKLELNQHVRSAWTHGLVVGLSFFLAYRLVHGLLAGVAIPGKTYVVPLIIGVCWWPVYPVMLRWTRGRKARALRDAYLASNHCASCDYDLARTPASADGRTQCPECGACWWLAPAGGATTTNTVGA